MVFLVNVTYLLLIWRLIEIDAADEASIKVRRRMRVRSLATLGLFALAAVVTLAWPLVGLAICCGCLLGYVRPEAPGVGR